MAYVLQEKPDEEITLDNGSDDNPVATLVSDVDPRVRAHIIVDDHCYVLVHNAGPEDQEYRMVEWWFREAVEALQGLPSDPDKARPLRRKSTEQQTAKAKVRSHDCSNLTLFADPPFEDDDRQVTFRRVAGQLLEEKGEEEVAVAETVRGWPASRVDMGWIQEKVCDWWERHPEATAVELIEKVDDELPCVIQRIKKLRTLALNAVGQRVRVTSDSFRRVGIELTTKDDHGYYDYRFWVHLPERRMKVVE